MDVPPRGGASDVRSTRGVVVGAGGGVATADAAGAPLVSSPAAQWPGTLRMLSLLRARMLRLPPPKPPTVEMSARPGGRDAVADATCVVSSNVAELRAAWDLIVYWRARTPEVRTGPAACVVAVLYGWCAVLGACLRVTVV